MNIKNLETLILVRDMFTIHSDGSTQCNGYYNLCKIIENIENKRDNCFSIESFEEDLSSNDLIRPCKNCGRYRNEHTWGDPLNIGK